jgi:hypothetical protein
MHVQKEGVTRHDIENTRRQLTYDVRGESHSPLRRLTSLRGKMGRAMQKQMKGKHNTATVSMTQTGKTLTMKKSMLGSGMSRKPEDGDESIDEKGTIIPNYTERYLPVPIPGQIPGGPGQEQFHPMPAKRYIRSWGNHTEKNETRGEAFLRAYRSVFEDLHAWENSRQKFKEDVFEHYFPGINKPANTSADDTEGAENDAGAE